MGPPPASAQPLTLSSSPFRCQHQGPKAIHTACADSLLLAVACLHPAPGHPLWPRHAACSAVALASIFELEKLGGKRPALLIVLKMCGGPSYLIRDVEVFGVLLDLVILLNSRGLEVSRQCYDYCPFSLQHSMYSTWLTPLRLRHVRCPRECAHPTAASRLCV